VTRREADYVMAVNLAIYMQLLRRMGVREVVLYPSALTS
jgi:hypothetical protein